MTGTRRDGSGRLLVFCGSRSRMLLGRALAALSDRAVGALYAAAFIAFAAALAILALF